MTRFIRSMPNSRSLVASALAASAALTIGTAMARADTVGDFTLHWRSFPEADHVPLLKATMTAVFNDGNHQAEFNGTSCSGAKGSATPFYWYCLEQADDSSLRDGPFEDGNQDDTADFPFDANSWIF